jgi:DNA-binding response OmpR family regulator
MKLPRVRLYHWKEEEAERLIAKLRAAGYEVMHKPQARTSTRELKESGAAAVVIDLSRMPSHGKYVGAWLRGSKSTRYIPLVFVGGEAKIA